MKNLQSIEEGKWVELVSVELTDAEKSLLASKEHSDEKLVLIQKIQNESKKAVSASVAKKANTKYNEIKPIVEDTDVYELIAADFIFDDTDFVAGIVNYRLNEEHKQIRF